MHTDQIAQVRRFNRLVTQRAGALDESFLRRGRSLGQARLIFELGTEARDLRELCRALDLDRRAMRRLLDALVTDDLVIVSAAPGGGRLRQARLTPKGLGELAAYSRCSDGQARGLLARLGEGQRLQLMAAMAEVEQLLRAATVEVQLQPATSAEALWCLAQYYDELRERFEEGFDPGEGRSGSPLDM